MRLIDANKVDKEITMPWQKAIILSEICEQPTIDPETLPLVQELRAELERVTAERDALKMNPPVRVESNAFELALRLADTIAERDAALTRIKQLERCGKWEWVGPCRDSHGTLWATCSVCKTRQHIGDYQSYCPNCGAKMNLEGN